MILRFLTPVGATRQHTALGAVPSKEQPRLGETPPVFVGRLDVSGTCCPEAVSWMFHSIFDVRPPWGADRARTLAT